MKFDKVFLICLIALVMIVATIYGATALGVSRPYEKDNTYEVDANETLELTFGLQNMDSKSAQLIFKIESQYSMEIEGGEFFEKQYTLDPGEMKDVEIEFYAEEEGLYRVDYSYAESCSSGDICFDVEVADVFFIQVGDDDTYWGFDIPLIYDGFRLYTESMSASNVNDLEIVSEDGLVEVDFSGSSIDLRDFDESYVSFGTRKVTLNSNSFPDFDNEAIITMYQVNDNYVIYKDGSKCSSSVCDLISYGNKRLRFEVDGFSTYEVKYEVEEEEEEPAPSSGSSGGGGGGGGIIPPREDIEEVEVNDVPEPIEVVKEEKPVDVGNLINAPNPFESGEKKEVEKIDDTKKTNTLSAEAKTLLTRVLILGALSLIITGGLLFYYKKDQKTGDSK